MCIQNALIVVAHSRSVPSPLGRRDRTRVLEQQLVPFFRIDSHVREERLNLVALPSRTRQKQLRKACSRIRRESGRREVTQRRTRDVAGVSEVISLRALVSTRVPRK